MYHGARPEELPWYTRRLDADIEATLQELQVEPGRGPVLDLGTGPGTAAIHLARNGFRVTALDISPAAIQMAQRRAGDLGTRIRWVVGDLLERSFPAEFQLILDRGVYHSLSGPDRGRYPDVVAPWLRPGGHLVLKAFSPLEPGDWGPNRISRDELESNVGGRLETLRISAARFPGTLGHEPHAWLCVFRASARPG